MSWNIAFNLIFRKFAVLSALMVCRLPYLWNRNKSNKSINLFHSQFSTAFNIKNLSVINGRNKTIISITDFKSSQLDTLSIFIHQKALQLPFCFFFSFLTVFLEGLSKVLFRNVSSFVIQEACGQDRTDFIGHIKKSFRKNWPLSCCLRHVWHGTCHVIYRK